MAVPLDGTLGELSECVEDVTGSPMPGLELGNAESYLSAFDTSLWRRIRAEEFDVVQQYASPREVVRGVQAIGARCSGHGGSGVLGAGVLRQVMALYKQRFSRSDGKVPATYKVLMFIAERY